MSGSFLSNLHSHGQTSETTLRTVSRDLAGLTITTLSRLSRGYANEVYVATTEQQQDVLIRIQVLSLQANIAMTYLAHDFRLGNADSRAVVLAGLRSILAAWHATE